jgi:hypothetical protein
MIIEAALISLKISDGLFLPYRYQGHLAASIIENHNNFDIDPAYPCVYQDRRMSIATIFVQLQSCRVNIRPGALNAPMNHRMRPGGAPSAAPVFIAYNHDHVRLTVPGVVRIVPPSRRPGQPEKGLSGIGCGDSGAWRDAPFGV